MFLYHTDLNSFLFISRMKNTSLETFSAFLSEDVGSFEEIIRHEIFDLRIESLETWEKFWTKKLGFGQFRTSHN